jgi:hypothetical protein
MSRIHITALFSLLALAVPASPLFAQVFVRGGSGGIDRSVQGRATDRNDIYTCNAAPGGSRVRENCDVVTEIRRLEREMKLANLFRPPPPLMQCGGSTTTQYRQLDKMARISGTLEIHDCAAASGTITVAVVIKNESGAEKVLEFEEPWQRSDDRNVSFSADYPLGEHVELVDVRLSGLTCTCDDAAPPEPSSAEE